jgi:hypothetical protein
MMSQILASTNNNLSQNDLGSKKPRDGIEITPPSAAFYVKKKDTSKVLCKKLGHYAKKCPEGNNKVNKQRRTYLVTYQKCNQKGHYARRCIEKSTTKLQ